MLVYQRVTKKNTQQIEQSVNSNTGWFDVILVDINEILKHITSYMIYNPPFDL